MLDRIPLEILIVILDLLVVQDHISLFRTSTHFRNHILGLVRKAIFTRQRDLDFMFNRYTCLQKIELRDCLPTKPQRTEIQSVRIDFSPSYCRKLNGSTDLGNLFEWITKLELVEFSSNVDIGPSNLPLIFTQPSLHRLNIEFFIPKTLDLISDSIEEISILLFQSEKITDLSRFVNLRFISIVGVLTPSVIKSLRTIPRSHTAATESSNSSRELSIQMTLLMAKRVKKEDLDDLPITTLNLSGFEGDVELFNSISTLKRVVFPSSIKKKTVKSFIGLPDCRFRIAEHVSLHLDKTGSAPYHRLTDRPDLVYNHI